MLLKHLQHMQHVQHHPIYFCNIYKKQLQHTFKTAETPETYICNIEEGKSGSATSRRGWSLWTAKSDRSFFAVEAHEASREKPCGADPELSPGLGRAPDRMVVTESVSINLILKLTKRES
jgi:kynureninase